MPGLLTRSAPRRDGLLLTALAFLLALIQRPGRATSETKIDLHVDPVGFLADAASLWSPTADLGHVHGGQYSGYLFPMGPFFALGDLAGLPAWLVQRLWLGAVLALRGLGRRAAGRRAARRRGATPARIVAGLITLLNPYVVVFANRTRSRCSPTRRCRGCCSPCTAACASPRSWWWPAAAGLISAPRAAASTWP